MNTTSPDRHNPSQRLQPPTKSLSAREIAVQGLRKAISSALWVYRILIPVSFFTLILQVSHLLEHMEGVLGPVMGLLNLPAKAAMPIVAGLLTGIYGGVAAIAVLGFTLREATLIAVFLLISHNMIQESAIQGQSGIAPLKAALIRLVTSVIVVWAVAFLWSAAADEPIVAAVTGPAPIGLAAHFKLWLVQTAQLCLKIFLILIVIMTTVVWMKARQVAHRLARFLGPVLTFMGLNRDVGLLWLTAVLFGVAYGGAVIVEEARTLQLPREDLERLHMSIGINHAMIEDPALFLSLGIAPFWLWVPRLAAAFLAVRILQLTHFVRRRFSRSQLRNQPPGEVGAQNKDGA